MDGGDKKGKKLTVPSCPDVMDSEGHYSVSTMEEKIVRDYTGFDFGQLESLTIFDFWLYLRDAVVFNCQQTEEGRDYLEKCWVAEQTEPDRKMLRHYFGKH